MFSLVLELEMFGLYRAEHFLARMRTTNDCGTSVQITDSSEPSFRDLSYGCTAFSYRRIIVVDGDVQDHEWLCPVISLFSARIRPVTLDITVETKWV